MSRACCWQMQGSSIMASEHAQPVACLPSCPTEPDALKTYHYYLACRTDPARVTMHCIIRPMQPARLYGGSIGRQGFCQRLNLTNTWLHTGRSGNINSFTLCKTPEAET